MTTTITADNGSITGSAGLKSSADSSGVLALATGSGTTAVTIDASQNMGIGTSSPNVKFQLAQTISTTIGNSSTYLGLGVGENAVNGLRLIGYGYKSTYYPAYTGYIETNNSGSTNGALTFYTRSVTTDTAPTEVMRIDSSGNLLVGTTTALGKVAIVSNSITGQYPLYLNDSSSSGSNIIVDINHNGSRVGSISTTTTLTSYNVSSDYRLKENVVPLTGALVKIAQLKPSLYNYKADPSTNIEGFLAHELQEIVPHAVTGEKDAVDADGNPIYQGVDASFLIPHLVAAIQEQQQLITTLTERITALEGAKQ
jgi:Chaperone of endosialidase